MDSEEAIMENENNSNLESESGRAEQLTADGIFHNVAPVVSSDISTAVTFTGVGSSDSAANTNSAFNQSVVSTNVEEWETMFEDKSVEAEQLEGTAKSVLELEKGTQDCEDLADTDNLPNNEETHSRTSGSFNLNHTDDTESMMELSNPQSHKQFDSAVFSHSDNTSVSLTAHNIKEMEVSEISEPSIQSSEIGNNELQENAKTVVQLKDSDTFGNTSEMNQSSELPTLAGTSQFTDDDIDLLAEDSNDSTKEKDNNENLGNLTESMVRPVLRDQNSIYKTEKPSASLELRTSKTDTSNTLQESGAFNTTEPGVFEGNSAEEFPESLLAQHSKVAGFEDNVKNVDDIFHEGFVTHVKKKNETLASSDILKEAGVISSNDLVNENISGMDQSEVIAMEDDGAQDSDINTCHEKVDNSIYYAKGEQSLQEANVVSEDVVPTVMEHDERNDHNLKLSSVSCTMSKSSLSPEFSKQTDAANKNTSTEMELTPPVISEDSDLLTERVGADLFKDTLCHGAVAEQMEIASGENQTIDQAESCRLSDDKSADKTNYQPENSSKSTSEDSLETDETEIVKTSKTSTDRSDSGENISITGDGSLSHRIPLTKNVDPGQCGEEKDDEDIMEISVIKKELNTYDSPTVYANEPRSVEIKQEITIVNVEDSEDDVIIIGDEGEFIPVKREIFESQTTENGLDNESSGQQPQLQGSGEENPSVSTNTEITSDSSMSKSAKSKLQTCIVCHKISRCKYNIVRNGDFKHLCGDVCFKQFRLSPGLYLTPKGNAQTPQASIDTVSMLPHKGVLTTSSVDKMGSQQDDLFKTCAVCQLVDINSLQPFCNWKGLDFCGETCLGKFQANLNTSCSFCLAYIPIKKRTLFCLKIGNDMRPFCKQGCYSEFQKNLRLCSFCQRDVATVPEAFTAMVGADGKFKEFCSQACLTKLESQINNVEILCVETGNLTAETVTCSVCEKHKPMKYSVRLQGKLNKLCSDLCFSAFQYTNKFMISKCDSCGTPCTTEEVQAHFMQFEGKVKRFCSDLCTSNFRKINGKVLPCGWCSAKKLNFDMIERLDAENKFQMFCSLTCLSLFRVNLQAKSYQPVPCHQCRQVVPAQYHLTMSDASVLNFCSYTCVMIFQTQFTAKQNPTTLSSAASPAEIQTQQRGTVTPVQQNNGSGRGGRMTTRQVSKQQTPTLQQNPILQQTLQTPPTLLQTSTFPVISNVVSLAPPGGGDPQVQNLHQASLSAPPNLVPTQQAALSAPPNLVATHDVATGMAGSMLPSGDGKHQILIQAAPPKYGKNKCVQCRPFTQTKATSCRPHSQSKEVQTDEVVSKPMMVPVPVPIYIPMPTVMFSAPAPKLIPIPIPIPVPVFIPTTRKSVKGICKTIQEIVTRIPADPLEAELLMMAEAVAAGKSDDSDSDPETIIDEDFESEVMRSGEIDNESQIERRGDGLTEENLMQTALRMAEEMSGPIGDLETSVAPVAVSAEPPAQQLKPVESNHSQDDDADDDNDADYQPPQTRRAVKRSSKSRQPQSRPKRQRKEKSYNEDDSVLVEPSAEINSTEPQPDANFHLKFSYGLNAWRHWVIGKNMQIEKTNSEGNLKGRVFPTDILKCTMDELNMSLCMFVKEVRKPSGQEYSPDSIYYLCLGLQLYLYENSRIDSVFTDTYFERFTESLHEVLANFHSKVNSHGQMLCRIEEEHLWESKQLGAHSPYVLLNTLIYFHTKHFILKSVQDHMNLSFAQILKHWKKGMPLKGQTASTIKNVSLRFYCLNNGKKEMFAKKNKEGVPVYEVTENVDNPLRCPVKLYEFFLSKCPESIKNRNDIFYPVPERSCVPDSPVWYSTLSIDNHTLNKMLTRVLLVREIQEAIMHAQPIYL